jgi:hypothetical protein
LSWFSRWTIVRNFVSAEGAPSSQPRPTAWVYGPQNIPEGFYETAGPVNVFVFAFSLFGVFVFVLAVAFAFAAKWLGRRIHLGLLYALVEGRLGPGAGWCPMKMNWGCYLKDGLWRPSPRAQSPKREMDSSAAKWFHFPWKSG